MKQRGGIPEGPSDDKQGRMYQRFLARARIGEYLQGFITTFTSAKQRPPSEWELKSAGFRHLIGNHILIPQVRGRTRRLAAKVELMSNSNISSGLEQVMDLHKIPARHLNYVYQYCNELIPDIRAMPEKVLFLDVLSAAEQDAIHGKGSKVIGAAVDGILSSTHRQLIREWPDVLEKAQEAAEQGKPVTEDPCPFDQVTDTPYIQVPPESTAWRTVVLMDVYLEHISKAMIGKEHWKWDVGEEAMDEFIDSLGDS